MEALVPKPDPGDAVAPTPRSCGYDAVVVGASLAGCSTAILLGRQGARVALVEKQPSPAAFKRVCSHSIQASAVPTLERLGLLGPIRAAGGVRSRLHAWTPWGWIEAPPERAARSVNLRREVLDPLVREAAAATRGSPSSPASPRRRCRTTASATPPISRERGPAARRTPGPGC